MDRFRYSPLYHAMILSSTCKSYMIPIMICLFTYAETILYIDRRLIHHSQLIPAQTSSGTYIAKPHSLTDKIT